MVIKYAAVSWAATPTLKVVEAVYVPDRSVPAHMSCTLKFPEVPNPGTAEKVNCLVAVADEVLIMNTWTPLLDAPE